MATIVLVAFVYFFLFGLLIGNNKLTLSAALLIIVMLVWLGCSFTEPKLVSKVDYLEIKEVTIGETTRKVIFLDKFTIHLENLAIKNIGEYKTGVCLKRIKYHNNYLGIWWQTPDSYELSEYFPIQK